MKRPAALVLSLLLFTTCLCPVCFAAESTYGLKKDGSIVFSGCPNWLGFDVGGVESATLKAALDSADQEEEYVYYPEKACQVLFLGLFEDGSASAALCTNPG